VAEGRVRAFAGAGDGGGVADARVAAGDQRAAAGEAARADVAVLAAVRPRLQARREAGPGLLLRRERRARAA
jgi:hypothetical protein